MPSTTTWPNGSGTGLAWTSTDSAFDDPHRVGDETFEGHLCAQPSDLPLDQCRIRDLAERRGADQPEAHGWPLAQDQGGRADQLQLSLGRADPPEQAHDRRVRRPAPAQVVEHLVRASPGHTTERSRTPEREAAVADELAMTARGPWPASDRTKRTVRAGR
jgi:hypothetical protein